MPSSAKYEDWIGIRMWVAATMALTVIIPSVGGVSMTIASYRLRAPSSLSRSRKWPSISPRSLDSIFASAIRAGATSRFFIEDFTTTWDILTAGSVRTSNIDFSIERRSTYDIVLLAWGSRSMRRVFMPFWARAAARLMAVVVFPTPPFWFAMQMTTEKQYSSPLSNSAM